MLKPKLILACLSFLLASHAGLAAGRNDGKAKQVAYLISCERTFLRIVIDNMKPSSAQRGLAGELLKECTNQVDRGIREGFWPNIGSPVGAGCNFAVQVAAKTDLGSREGEDKLFKHYCDSVAEKD